MVVCNPAGLEAWRLGCLDAWRLGGWRLGSWSRGGVGLLSLLAGLDSIGSEWLLDRRCWAVF